MYLVFVGFGVNNKDQGVVVLNLLHGRLGGQGMLDDIVSVHPNRQKNSKVTPIFWE